jgi:hypothetical protein
LSQNERNDYWSEEHYGKGERDEDQSDSLFSEPPGFFPAAALVSFHLSPSLDYEYLMTVF